MIKKLLCFASFFSFGLFAQESDDPVLNSISFTPSTVEAGSTLGITFNISDASDLESITADLDGTRIGSYFSLEDFTKLSATEYYTEVEISEWTAPGDYTLSWISIEDIYGNSIFTSSNTEVTITNDNPDITAPVLESLTVSNTEVEGGQEIIFTLDITETQSGLDLIDGRFESAGGNSEIRFATYSNYKTRDLEDGRIEIHVVVSEFVEPGVYSISSLSIDDEAGNTANISDSEITFTVVGTTLDETDPVITAVSFSESSIDAGESFVVSVTASDDISGIDYISVELENNEGESIEAEGLVALVWDESNGVYSFEVNTTEYISGGEYSIDRLTIEDAADNREVDFSPVFTSTITVNSSNEDITDPILGDYSINKTAINAGESVTFTFDATDENSGLGTIAVAFRGEGVVVDDGATLYPLIYREVTSEELTSLGNDEYSFDLVSDVFLTVGEYTLSSIQLYDNAGNGFWRSPGSDPLTITVSNDDPDVAAPVIVSAEFASDQVVKGDTAVLVIEINDDSFDGALSISIEQGQFYDNPPRGAFLYGTSLDFLTQVSANTWEYRIATDELNYGLWTLGEVYALDQVGNLYEDTPFDDVSFEVVDMLDDDPINSLQNANADNGFNIYPNPTSTTFDVSLSSVETVSIYDLSGKLLSTFSSSDSYNVSNLEPGVYMIKAITNSDSYVTKMLVKLLE